MEVSFKEDRRLLLSVWRAAGGHRICRWLADLWHDPLMEPLAPEHLTDKDLIGQLGETLAAAFLRRRESMRILAKNFRAPGGGEVDLVCRHLDTLVFVEVKTRSSRVHGRPLEAVNPAKQHLIARGALEWLRLLDRPAIPFRFDVVEVILEPGSLPEVNRVQNAFSLPDDYFLPG